MGALSGIAADEIKTILDKWTSERRTSRPRSSGGPPTGETIPGKAVVDEQDAVGRLI
jgi:hypothetical protein